MDKSDGRKEKTKKRYLWSAPPKAVTLVRQPVNREGILFATPFFIGVLGRGDYYGYLRSLPYTKFLTGCIHKSCFKMSGVRFSLLLGSSRFGIGLVSVAPETFKEIWWFSCVVHVLLDMFSRMQDALTRAQMGLWNFYHLMGGGGC